MAIKLEIFDGTIPLLDEIAKVNNGAANEALSVAGTIVRNAIRTEFKLSQKHSWFQRVINGKRTIFISDRANKIFGKRFSHSNGRVENPANMFNFITSYLDERNNLVVIGGKHKAFRASRYEDGVKVGTFGRVAGVSQKTHAILIKLNSGVLTDEFKQIGSSRGNPLFRNANYKARGFIERGRARGLVMAVPAIRKRYEQIIGKRINNADGQPLERLA